MDCPGRIVEPVVAGSPTSIAVQGKTEAILSLSCEAVKTAGIPARLDVRQCV